MTTISNKCDRPYIVRTQARVVLPEYLVVDIAGDIVDHNIRVREYITDKSFEILEESAALRIKDEVLVFNSVEPFHIRPLPAALHRFQAALPAPFFPAELWRGGCRGAGTVLTRIVNPVAQPEDGN